MKNILLLFLIMMLVSGCNKSDSNNKNAVQSDLSSHRMAFSLVCPNIIRNSTSEVIAQSLNQLLGESRVSGICDCTFDHLLTKMDSQKILFASQGSYGLIDPELVQFSNESTYGLAKCIRAIEVSNNNIQEAIRNTADLMDNTVKRRAVQQ